LTFPAEIVGKRIRIKLDGSRLIKVQETREPVENHCTAASHSIKTSSHKVTLKVKNILLI
jgi:hypothetical protein